jgi:nucleoside-diphosphate-sugar epimerase
MSVFVTGGSGFVGRRLLSLLVGRGTPVRALARTSQSQQVVRQLGAEPIVGDLHDVATMSAGMQGAAVVYHVAGHLRMWDSLANFRRTNVEGTRAVLEAARQAGVPRLVQVGAAAVVMGMPEPIQNAREELPIHRHAWAPYIASKAEAEELVLRANSPLLSTGVVRPPLIWGAEAPLLPDIIDEVKAGRFRWIDQGQYAFSACHVINVCHGTVLAGERGRPGQVYFLTDGRDYRFREFWTALLTRLQVQPPTASVPFGMGWQIARVIDSTWRTLHLRSVPPLSRQMLRMIGQPFTLSIDKARQELDYEPQVSFDEGLQEFRPRTRRAA